MSKIKITKKEQKMLERLIKRILKEKKKEDLHRYDHGKEEERWMTGLMGELAVEKLTGITVIDWTAGPSILYKAADLKKSGYNIGVKTIKKVHMFPVISRQNKTPQIICVRDGDIIEVLGIATADDLNTYQDDSYIIDKHMLSRKTCFTGLQYLTDINNLKKYKINKH